MTKNQLLWTAVIIISVIVFVGWSFTLKHSIKSIPQATKEEGSMVNLLSETTKILENSKKEFSQLKTITEQEIVEQKQKQDLVEDLEEKIIQANQQDSNIPSEE